MALILHGIRENVNIDNLCHLTWFSETGILRRNTGFSKTDNEVFEIKGEWKYGN